MQADEMTMNDMMNVEIPTMIRCDWIFINTC